MDAALAEWCPTLMKRLAGTCRETLDGRSAFIPPPVAPRCAFSNTSECSPTSDGVEQRRWEREREGEEKEGGFGGEGGVGQERRTQ